MSINPELYIGAERFYKPNYVANLVSSWLPALDGVVPKLANGARVADVGCGYGVSTILMAQAYPNSRFFGFDYHELSIQWARKRAEEGGVSDRVRFETVSARHAGRNYDLITMFNCLHEYG